MHGNGDASLTTILQEFLLFWFFVCLFLNKNNYQLPIPSWQGPGGLENQVVQRYRSLVWSVQRDNLPLPWGGCIDCPSPRHGLFHAARMGLKGGLFVLGPRIIKCGLWMGLRQEQLAGVLACLGGETSCVIVLWDAWVSWPLSICETTCLRCLATLSPQKVDR